MFVLHKIKNLKFKLLHSLSNPTWSFLIT